MSIVYSNIKSIRESKKLRQEDMAKKLDMAKNSYSLLERAEISLTVERLESIAKIFNMTPVEIYDYHLIENKEKDKLELQHMRSKFSEIGSIYSRIQDQINFFIMSNSAPICFCYNEHLNTTSFVLAKLKEDISEEKRKELLLYQFEFKQLTAEESIVKFRSDFDKKYSKIKK